MTRLVVIDTEHPRELAGAIGTHGVLYLFQHPFVPLPGKVYEFGVGAHRNDFSAGLLEFIILLRQSSKFRRSDKGKVGRVEEKDSPFFCSHLGREAYFSKITPGWFVGLDLKVMDGLSNTDTAAIFRHDIALLCRYRIYKVLIYHFPGNCQEAHVIQRFFFLLLQKSAA